MRLRIEHLLQLYCFLGCVVVILASPFERGYAQIAVSRDQFGYDTSNIIVAQDNEDADSVFVGIADTVHQQLWDFRARYFEYREIVQWKSPPDQVNRQRYLSANSEFDIIQKIDDLRDTLRDFYVSSSDSLAWVGNQRTGDIASVPIVVTSGTLPELIFPLTLGKKWNGQATMVSGGTTMHVVCAAQVDAFGTLRLPSGSYDALRVRTDYSWKGGRRTVFRFVTGSRYIGLSIISFGSPDIDKPFQLFASCYYTDPSLKPALRTPSARVHLPDSIPDALVGKEQRFPIIIRSTGDTAVRLLELSWKAISKPLEFTMDSTPPHVMLQPGDSITAFAHFRPTVLGTSEAYFDVNTGGLFTDYIVSAKGDAAKTVKWENSEPAFPQLYPNPAKRYFRISGHRSIAKFEIMDVLGRLVLKEVDPAPLRAIDCSGLRSGLFMVRMTCTDGSVFFQKLEVDQ